MKGLSVPQPYASLMRYGIVTTFVTNAATQVRGPVVLCSSRRPFLGEVHRLGQVVGKENQMDVGRTMARAEISGVWPMRPGDAKAAFVKYRRDLWCWGLTNIKPLNPSPVKGRGRFFDVDDRCCHRIVDLSKVEQHYWELGFWCYKDYWASPLWKAIRDRIVKRDQEKCQACGGRGTQVHHLRYDRDVMFGWNDSKLELLCGYCHRKKDCPESLEQWSRAILR
jgi:hypothetical protein